jgi:hypothetical protein
MVSNDYELVSQKTNSKHQLIKEANNFKIFSPSGASHSKAQPRQTTERPIHWGKFGSGHGIIIPRVSFQRRNPSKTLQAGADKLQRALRKSKSIITMH